MQDNNIPFYRSPERALRMFAHSARYAKLKAQAAGRSGLTHTASARIEGGGALSEHLGKALLRKAGLAVPEGGLVSTVDEAVALAMRIGFPVVLKVQSAQLLHKTEIGGVAIGLVDAVALRTAWDAMATRVNSARPDADIDGYLVETMAPKGLEMVVGGRRDPNWGPVVLFGLGGIWIETLKDVRLIPADMPEAQIVDELGKLKASSLLEGARGSAPIDTAALAKVVAQIGHLLLTHPEIAEIDVNPLVAYPVGVAPVALDALIILE